MMAEGNACLRARDELLLKVRVFHGVMVILSSCARTW